MLPKVKLSAEMKPSKQFIVQRTLTCTSGRINCVLVKRLQLQGAVRAVTGNIPHPKQHLFTKKGREKVPLFV